MKPKAEEKKEVIAKIEEAIDNEKAFLILTEGSDETGESAVMMGGEFHDMARMVSIAMSKLEPLEMVIDAANAALDFARSRKELRSDNVADALKCDTCDKRNECDIFNAKVRMENGSDNPMEIMKDLFASMKEKGLNSIKPKGDC